MRLYFPLHSPPSLDTLVHLVMRLYFPPSLDAQCLFPPSLDMLVSLFPPSLDMLVSLFPPSLDTLVSLTPLSLPPPQIVLTKDARFVDLFRQHRKKVNQGKMRTNKCPLYAMQFQEESVVKDWLVSVTGY
jgi:hypothetical protein